MTHYCPDIFADFSPIIKYLNFFENFVEGPLEKSKLIGAIICPQRRLYLWPYSSDS